MKKIIHEQKSSFLTNNSILYNYQSWFWKNKLVDSCLIFWYDEILKGFMIRASWLGWYWLISKTIDRIHQNILQKKNESSWFLISCHWWVQIIPFKSNVKFRKFRKLFFRKLLCWFPSCWCSPICWNPLYITVYSHSPDSPSNRSTGQPPPPSLWKSKTFWPNPNKEIPQLCKSKFSDLSLIFTVFQILD